MSYRCCGLMQSFALNFNGRIDTGEPVISLCCEELSDIPKIGFSETAEETLRRFVGEGLLAAVECARSVDDSQRHFTKGCLNCAQFCEGDYNISALISYVNLSMYPAPCQSRCIYCDVYKETSQMKSDAVKTAYDKMFDMLDLAESSGILSPNATWQVSSGEIAIHPYHDRIMKLVRGKRVMFYTNCMKFDDDVAQTLHDNPNSAINLSIGAGTPETWKRVKGVDNFDLVLENLQRYHAASVRPGQITMKYIVLPDINDIYEDYDSLMKIIKALDVKHLTLARDTRIKYSLSIEEQTKLMEGAAYLLAMCHKNGISFDMFTYTPEEREKVIQQANEVLQKS